MPFAREPRQVPAKTPSSPSPAMPPTRTTPLIPRAVTARHSLPCPKCGVRAAKEGVRRTSAGPIQKWYCPSCRSHFSESPIPRRQYAAKVILNAVTTYHLGHTLTATRQAIARRFKRQVPESTLRAWLRQFSALCTFATLRKKFSFSDPIVARTFHHRQEYCFGFHRLKVNLLCKDRFPSLRRYLWRVKDHCPHRLFTADDSARCSDALRSASIRAFRHRDNNAVALAKLGLMLASRATERHGCVQQFMLANDSATVAVEVPVWLLPGEARDLGLTAPLTGHIDIVQIRFGRVVILDYKPDARRETKAKDQVYRYARALSVRTGIPFAQISMAYFDDKDYFEVVAPHIPERRL